MSIKNQTPRIYVACLASYNEGILYGQWMDADKEPEELLEDIQAMLTKSPVKDAEEWAIHDSEHFGAYDVHQYAPLEDIATVALGISEYGTVFADWLEHTGEKPTIEAQELFQEAYRGHFRSLEEYAEELLDDTGELSALPDYLQGYFDYTSFARDLELGGDVFTISAEGGVHVFVNI